MATIGYYEPRLVGSGSIKEPKKFLVNPAQGAAWRRGDIVVQSTVGTIVALNPAGAGALAASAGPSTGLTTTTTASAGAPAASYYGAATFTATAQESQPTYFIINCPAGFLPQVNVAVAGAPAGATNYAVYLGLFPGYLALQQATKTTTALGTAFTASNPLANSFGANRAATNVSGLIWGLADSMSDETYFDGTGGSFTAGRASSRLGASNSIAPLTPTEAPMLYVIGLGFGQLVEMSLNQNTAWSPMLLNTQVGITVDPTTGFPTVDPTQTNKVAVIVDQRPGVYVGPTASGSSGDLGARVIVEFLAAALAVQ